MSHHRLNFSILNSINCLENSMTKTFGLESPLNINTPANNWQQFWSRLPVLQLSLCWDQHLYIRNNSFGRNQMHESFQIIIFRQETSIPIEPADFPFFCAILEVVQHKTGEGQRVIQVLIIIIHCTEIPKRLLNKNPQDKNPESAGASCNFYATNAVTRSLFEANVTIA